VLRRAGCTFEEVGLILGLSPFAASVYAIAGGVWPAEGNRCHRENLLGQAILAAAIELFADGELTWAWRVDGEPVFRLANVLT
jgi:hypothetical protein